MLLASSARSRSTPDCARGRSRHRESSGAKHQQCRGGKALLQPPRDPQKLARRGLPGTLAQVGISRGRQGPRPAVLGSADRTLGSEGTEGPARREHLFLSETMQY